MSDENPTPPSLPGESDVQAEYQRGPVLVGAPEPRIWAGWILLVILFGLMILGQVALAIDPRATQGEAKSSAPSRIQDFVGVRLGAIQAELGNLGGGANSQTATQAAETSYRTIRDQLAEEKPEDTAGIRLLSVLNRELKSEVDVDPLTKLKETKNLADQAYYQFYRGEKVGPAERAALEARSQNDMADRLLVRQIAVAEGRELTPIVTPVESFSLMAVMAGAAFAVFVGLGVWAVFLFMRLRGNWLEIGYPVRPLTPLKADILAVRMVAFLVIFSVAPLVTIPLTDVLGSAWSTVVAMTLVFGLIVLSLRIPIAGNRTSLRELLGRTERPFGLIATGLAGFCANLPVMIVLALVSQAVMRFLPEPTHPLISDLQEADRPGTVFALFIVAALFAPLVEEFTFRGMLFPALAKVLKSPVWGILLSGLMFAAVHPQGPVLWLPLMSVGCTAAYLSYRSGSLLPALVMHGVHNGALLLMNRVMT